MEASQQLLRQEELETQRCWTPVDFVEKLLHSLGHHNEDGLSPHSLGNHGQHKKNNHPCPAVTLFFDEEKNMTIACLSKRSKSLDVYFQCRVAQGTAFEKSPLYYELKGYIRENVKKIKSHEGFAPDSITLALGALSLSDKAHRQELLDNRYALLQKRHGRRIEVRPDNDTLERVLEVVRLHRLGDDLDIMSIFCMRLTSKVFGKVAAKIASERLHNVRMKLTPFVDGAFVNGYSKFLREASGGRLVRTAECGRAVEYRKCSDIPLSATGLRQGEFGPETSTVSNFSWKCEEIALANLHRWWGDIVVRDYVGHKLVLTWEPDPADSCCFRNQRVPLTTVRLEPCEMKGHHTFVATSSSASITMDADAKISSSSDDVTTAYEGNAAVEKVYITFTCLVRVCARAIYVEYQRAAKERQRPLLDHELDYLAVLKEASRF